MFHMLAYGAAALDASAGNVQLVGIADDIFQRQNSNFQFPSEHWIMAARLGGALLTRGRLRAGSFQNKGLPQFWPLDTAVLPPSNGSIMDFRQYPIRLRAEEDLRVDVTNTAAGDTAAFVWVSNTLPNYNVNVKPLRWLRFTASVTSVAYGWSTPGACTFEDNLEAGLYSVYGLAVFEADCIAARLLFTQQQYRPGCLGQAAIGDQPRPIFNGGLGLWGQFNTYSLPQIEAVHVAAAAQTLEGRMLVGKEG